MTEFNIQGIDDGVLFQFPEVYGSELFMRIKDLNHETYPTIFEVKNANPESSEFGESKEWDLTNTNDAIHLEEGIPLAKYNEIEIDLFFQNKAIARRYIKEALFNHYVPGATLNKSS